MMTCVFFVLSQTMTYYLYEVPLFIAMGAIGKNFLYLDIQTCLKVLVPLHLIETCLIFFLKHVRIKSSFVQHTCMTFCPIE